MMHAAEMAKIQKPQVLDTREGFPIYCCVAPVYHTYGLYMTSFNNFLKPSTMVMLPKWDINLFFDSITKYSVTRINLVPSLVHQVVHHPRFETADLSLITDIGSSAAYLSPQLAAQLCARFPGIERITGGYGLSEFVVVAMKPLPGMLNGRAKNEPGSVGKLSLYVPMGLSRAQTRRVNSMYVGVPQCWDTREISRQHGRHLSMGGCVQATRYGLMRTEYFSLRTASRTHSKFRGYKFLLLKSRICFCPSRTS